jgi:hypothetical protein
MRNLYVLDDFRGFLSPVVECFSLLDVSLMCENLALSTSCLKYGCTCGHCLEGFLLLRMKLVLLNQANIIYDFLLYNIEDGKYWVMDNEFWFRYVAYNV